MRKFVDSAQSVRNAISEFKIRNNFGISCLTFCANVVGAAAPAYALLQRAVVRISVRTECQKAFNLTASSVDLLCTSTAFSAFGRIDIGAGVIGWDKGAGKYRLLAVHTFRNGSNATTEKLSANTYAPPHAEWIHSVTKIIFN